MTRHVPVLLPEVLRLLEVDAAETVFDGTVGSGGHTKAFCTAVGEDGIVIGTDKDREAIDKATREVSSVACKTCLRTAGFEAVKEVIRDCGVESIDRAVLDLGFRSEQLEMNRGFSFQNDSPLVMTFQHPDDLPEDALTASKIVNEWGEESIESILTGYADEPHAKRIAAAITEARKRTPIKTTSQLVEIVKKATPRDYHRGRNTATRTFQAIRIAVNDEVGVLKKGLENIFSCIRPDGRFGVISFHSLEDRIVKKYFKRLEHNGRAERVTKSPVAPAEEEKSYNPRSRSAKLRVIQKMSD